MFLRLIQFTWISFFLSIFMSSFNLRALIILSVSEDFSVVSEDDDLSKCKGLMQTEGISVEHGRSGGSGSCGGC